MTDTKIEQKLKQALIEATEPHGAVARILSGELYKALPWLGYDAAVLSAHDILHRRNAEQIISTAEGPRINTQPGLPIGKTDELIELLVQPQTGSAPSADALIHIYANIKAQRKLHDALAKHVFADDGALEQALHKRLHEVSDLPHEYLSKLADDFIAARRMRAQEVVVALAPGGEVEKQAIEQANKLRRLGDFPAAPGKLSKTFLASIGSMLAKVTNFLTFGYLFSDTTVKDAPAEHVFEPIGFKTRHRAGSPNQEVALAAEPESLREILGNHTAKLMRDDDQVPEKSVVI